MALRRSSDLIGEVIDGYKVGEVLGRGGMGIVYKAVDTSLDRVVALKVMNPLLVEDEQFYRRFKAEAKALGRLRHPNIVGVFTLRHTEDHLFIVMEYVDGGTLMDLIFHHKAIPWQNTVPIIEQTLDAVDYAHRQHVIHRDIKPRNILISSGGIAKVTDFGLAKIQDLSAATRALTRTGITGGTLYYMPPEQLEGLANVDHRGDIYSLGMTYYVMLAGRSPFEKLSSEFAVLKAIDAHDFAALGELDTDIPEPLVRIVMKAVERDPLDRFQSAREMLEAIQAWQAPFSSEAPGPRKPSPTLSIERPRKPERERGTNRLLKTIKAWLANARPKARAPEASGRQDAKKERTLEPLQAGSKLPHARVAPQAEVVAPPQVAPPAVERVAYDNTLTQLPVAPQADVVAPAQVAPPPTPADLEETIIDEAPPVSPPPQEPEAQPLATEPQHEPGLASDVLPEPETSQEPDAVLEQEPLRGPTDLPEKEHRESTPSEPHTARPLWKRPVFGASLAAVLLAVLSFAVFQTLFDSPSGQSGGDVADTLASLTIRTVPEQVNVYLNDELLGSTPLMGYATTAGTLALHLEKDGYVPLDTSVTVEANETLAFDFELHRQREDTEVSGRDTTLEDITSTPTEVDEQDEDPVNQPKADLPALIPDLPETTIEEVLQNIGKVEDSVAVDTEDPQQSDTVTTTPGRGTLRIIIRPFGDIYVDGNRKASNTNRVYKTELSVGIHQVRAEHQVLGHWEKSIEVRAGEEQEVLFNFNQSFKVGVTSEPLNTQIIVDGIPQNRNTPAQISLPPGQHTIAVQMKGYVMEGAAREITLESNLKQPLRFILKKEQ